MTDLDQALADNPAAPEAATSAATGLRCGRHRWLLRFNGDDVCARCGRIKDPVTSRKGRNNRGRGLSIQRAVLARMGLRHIPGSQLIDGDNDGFTAEVKSGARFSGADWHEIAKQRQVCGTRMPMLVKVETPGPGHRARGLVVVDLDDWIRWYGPA